MQTTAEASSPRATLQPSVLKSYAPGRAWRRVNVAFFTPPLPTWYENKKEMKSLRETFWSILNFHFKRQELLDHMEQARVFCRDFQCEVMTDPAFLHLKTFDQYFSSVTDEQLSACDRWDPSLPLSAATCVYACRLWANCTVLWGLGFNPILSPCGLTFSWG